MDSIIQDVGCCWWSKLRLKGKTERQAVGGGGEEEEEMRE